MNCSVGGGKTSRSKMAMIAAGILVMTLACGPADYQKPILGFQDASNTVIAADRVLLSNMNTVEQNSFIDQSVFEHKTFGPADIDARTIISSTEIKMRTQALDALSRYTTNLATLAQGKAASSVGQDTKTLSTNLQTLAKDASNQLNPDKDQAAFNTKFSGVAGAAAAAIGAVAQLIMDHKARTEIEKSIKATDKDVTALIGLIGDDAQVSYLRQKAQMGSYGMQLYKDYSCEIAAGNTPASNSDGVQCPKKEKGVQGDPVALLTLADKIKSLRVQQAALENANPAPAIAQMKKSHEALVAYVSSNKSPQTLSDLITEVQAFISSAQPLGQAVQSLTAALK